MDSLLAAPRARPLPRSGRHRLAVRTIAYWLAAAAPFCVAVALHQRASGASTPLDRSDLALVAVALGTSGLFAFAIARAVEARRAAEAQSRRRLDLLHLVSDHVPSPIFLKGRDGRYLLCNLAFAKLLGRPREAILGRGMETMLPAEQAARHRAADDDLLQNGGSSRYESRVNLPGGAGDFLVTKAAVRDEEGAVVGVIATLVDITEIRARELEQRHTLQSLRRAKEEAEAGTRAKSHFLAVMSHEMRTPLNAVLGATDLLLDGPLSGEQREQAEMARTAGRALLELIDDVLDFSRIEAGGVDLERVPFDPRRLVRDTVALVAGPAREKGLALAGNVSGDVPGRVAGDPGRLRRVLLNLLSNAVKFTAEGGVEVNLGLLSRASGRATLRMEVRDTGIGIEPDQLPRLFEPFTQGDAGTSRRHGGTGLGLAIARRLVALMSGTIDVSSVPGRGSVFTCDVPFDEIADGAVGEPGPPPAADPVVAARPPRRRVLLAEDNATNQRVTRAQLERLGCTVDVAGDGAEAARAAAAVRYDVVFMDCRMPGLDGFAATRDIRRREAGRPPVPIVALTANALRGDRERCLAAGMSDYLAKPADLRSLAAALERHAPSGGRRSPAEPAQRPPRVLEMSALATLRTIEESEPGFLESLVRDFDQGFRDRLVDMQAAVREGDAAALGAAAHSLKGSARIVGAAAMADLCQRLERLADDESFARAGEALARLEVEHEALMPALHETAATP